MGEIEVLPILREGSQSQSGLLFALPAQFAMMRTCGAVRFNDRQRVKGRTRGGHCEYNMVRNILFRVVPLFGVFDDPKCIKT